VEPVSQPSYIAIARIVRPRGNRGEVLADLYTDNPARVDHLEEVWLELSEGVRERFVLENAWLHNGRQVLKFAGIDSISEAEKLVGAWVEVERDRAVKLPEGSYFDHDLVGCLVSDPGGAILGKVIDVLHVPGHDQWVVESERGEFFIPAVEEFCREVNIAEKKIVVDVPEGLIDLNK